MKHAPTRMTAAEFRKMKSSKPSKYRNVKTVVDGQIFDSKFESDRWALLGLLQRAGVVRKLRRQVRIPLLGANGIEVGVYVADFEYERFEHGDWQAVVEDAKSKPTKTAVYMLKKRLLRAQGIQVEESMRSTRYHQKGQQAHEGHGKKGRVSPVVAN